MLLMGGRSRVFRRMASSLRLRFVDSVSGTTWRGLGRCYITRKVSTTYIYLACVYVDGILDHHTEEDKQNSLSVSIHTRIQGEMPGSPVRYSKTTYNQYP